MSRDELMKIPRIAIIHGDPEWAKFMEPIKEAFEIPVTFFKDISIDDQEAWVRVYRTIIRRSAAHHANAPASK